MAKLKTETIKGNKINFEKLSYDSPDGLKKGDIIGYYGGEIWYGKSKKEVLKNIIHAKRLRKKTTTKRRKR